jgi:hypothetical protein
VTHTDEALHFTEDEEGGVKHTPEEENILVISC